MNKFPYFATNATLTYTIPDSTTPTFDPITGAPIFTETTDTVELSVEEGEDIGQNAPIVGKDQIVIEINGRCVNPKTLPSWIQPLSVIPVVYNSASFSNLNAQLHFGLNIKSRLNLDEFFGSPILGWLVFESF